MRALVRAELIKLSTVRTTFGLVLGAAAVAALGAFSTIASQPPSGLGGALHEQEFTLLASINLALFSLVVGIRIFADEFRHGSVVPALLMAPNRRRVLAAKAVAAAGAGVVLALTAGTVMVAVAIPLLLAKGAQVTVTGGDPLAAAGLVAASALWAVIGVAVGGAVRNQVPAIVGGLVWILVVENLGVGFLGDAGKFLPGFAGHALAAATAAPDLLAPAAGAVVLAGYTVLALAVAAVTLVRRDVVAG